jgi:hypothetical protein
MAMFPSKISTIQGVSMDKLFDKMELIKIEMNLLQGRFDKYDDLIFRSRNWFMTLWIACVGLSFTSKSTILPFLAVALSILYYLLEGLLRFNYWYKYVIRYRVIRDELNKGSPDINRLSVYDLTNKYMEEIPGYSRFKSSFIKTESILFYGGMAILGLLLGLLLVKGGILFPIK